MVGQLEGVHMVGEARMVVDAPLVAHEVRVDLRIDCQVSIMIKH